MKKLLTGKLFRFIKQWLLSRFAGRFSGKPKFTVAKRHKKLSPRHEHLLKVAQLFKSRLRQKDWARN